jgi:hypothetical protein
MANVFSGKGSLGIWPFKPDDVECAPGDTWSTLSQACVRSAATEACGEGNIWSDEAGGCIPFVSVVGTNFCQDGYEPDPKGGCRKKGTTPTKTTSGGGGKSAPSPLPFAPVEEDNTSTYFIAALVLAAGGFLVVRKMKQRQAYA